MKKINILVTLLSVSLIVGSQKVERRPWGAKRGSTTTTTKQTGHQPTSQAKKTTTGAARRTAGRPAAATKVPEGVDPIVWKRLSSDDQKIFNDLDKTFKSTVSLLSESDYREWRTSVINDAKNILNLDKGFLSYCVNIIKDELNEAEINIDKQQALRYIAGTLQNYISEKITTTGSEKDQFNNLLRNIEFKNNLPSAQWIMNVSERAMRLVQKGELTVEKIRLDLVAAFKEQYELVRLDDKLVAIVNKIIELVENKIAKVEQLKKPEYVYQTFRDLLLNLSHNEYWNMATMQPSAKWQQAIIDAGKLMKTVVGMPIADIEQQIGAEVFFVAVTTANRSLSKKETDDLVQFVTNVKLQIEGK